VAAISVIGFCGLLAYDHFDFRAKQGKWLSTYLPEARCDGARFTVVEREDNIQDWRYVTRISDSASCITSLRTALKARGATPSSIPGVAGLLLPGHTNSENEAVGFDFDGEPSAVIWTRDKT